MSTSVMPRRMAASTALVGVVGGILVLVLLLQRLGGADGYPTDPIGTVALGAAAVLAEFCRNRLAAARNPDAARLAGGLVASVLGYLILCAVAVGLASASSGPLGSVAVAVWSVAWIPPLVLSQLVASAAVRPQAGSPRIHAVVLTTAVVAMVAGAALWQPIDPFAGVAPIAPDAWPTRLAGIGIAATLVGFGGLLLLPLSLSRAAATSRDRARMRLGVAAAGTVAAPFVIVFCLILAIAADPGGVDPSAGSVAFQVAVAVGAAAGAICASLASGHLDRQRVALVTRAGTLAIAALAVAAVATLVVAAGGEATPTALIVAALAVGATSIAWHAGGRLGAALAQLGSPGSPGSKGSKDPPEQDGATPTPTPTHTQLPTHTHTHTHTPMHTPFSSTGRPPDALPRDGTAAADDVGLFPSPSAPTSAPPVSPQLTSREREVLSHLADGASNAGIAAQLVVSERTVDAHLRAIFTKLDLTPDPGANRRVRAAKLWLETRSSAE